MTDETERLVAEIDTDLKRLVDADRRTNKEVVEAALWTEYGGEKEGALDRRIEEKERRVSMIRSEKNERERELTEELNELEALETKRENMASAGQRIVEQAAETINAPADPENPAMQNWADKADMDPEEFADAYAEARDE